VEEWLAESPHEEVEEERLLQFEADSTRSVEEDE